MKKDTVDEVAEAMLALGEGTRLHVLFPLQAQGGHAEAEAARNQEAQARSASRETKREVRHPLLTDALKTRLFDLRKRGFNRLYQNGRDL